MPKNRGHDLSRMFDDLVARGRRINARVKAGRPHDQPMGDTARLSARHWVLSPLGGVTLENLDELFTGGHCDECSIPFGVRTRRRMRVRYDDPQSRWYNGVLAELPDWPKGPTFSLFSKRFLTLFRPSERRALRWRTVNVSNPTKVTPTLLEIVQSECHLPLVALRGGNPEREQCGRCGRRADPSYSLAGSLPTWLNPTGEPRRGDQPELFIAAGARSKAISSVFTVGDWVRGPYLGVSREKMWPAEDPPPAAAGIAMHPLGVVPPSLIEGEEKRRRRARGT